MDGFVEAEKLHAIRDKLSNHNKEMSINFIFALELLFKHMQNARGEIVKKQTKDEIITLKAAIILILFIFF